MNKLINIMLLPMIVPLAVQTHPGGTDTDKCHVDKSAGTRHCHDIVNDGYSRKNWRHWVDDDRDGLNTRQEVLIDESLTTVTISCVGSRCAVIDGTWVCPFTGDTITGDPRNQLDIDHRVPLKEAYLSGGSIWTKKQKKEFANDLSYAAHLVAVRASANRSKGAKDPSEWMPPDTSNHCAYIRKWVRVKKKYKLTMDKKERKFIKKRLTKCK